MAIKFLADENVRPRLWLAVTRHNARGGPPIDMVQVGGLPDLPLGMDDPDILQWAEREGRILVSADVHTLPTHLAEHLALGRHSPGVFLVRRGAALVDVVESLVLAAHASEPYKWHDRCQFVPFA